MAEEQSGQFWNIESMEVQLSESEKALRDMFVKEYLVDFDPVAACQRVGFVFSFAQDYSKLFMSESYVQRAIARHQRENPIDEKAQVEADKNLTLAVLRQAAQHGPFSSRVAAAAKLAAILGMDAPAKSSQEVLHRGGVMMVPGISSLDEWEQQAEKSQANLAGKNIH